MTELVHYNDDIRMELDEFSGKRTSFLDDAIEVIGYLKKNGVQPADAADYVNKNFLDFLCEFISGGIISLAVKKIGTSPEYYRSTERKEAEKDTGTETTFTFSKELAVNLGEIYPYVDIAVNACNFELKKLHFEFKLAGTFSLKNPGITILNGKITRVALGTVTPALALYYLPGPGEQKEIHTFKKPITFKEVTLKCVDMDHDPCVFPSREAA